MAEGEVVTIVLLVDDTPHVLLRVSGVFHRCNQTIDRLVYGRTDRPGCTRMEVAVKGPLRRHNLLAQLANLVEVRAVQLA